MINGDNLNFSPEKKKINYYEENPKLIKKAKKRQSLVNTKNIEHNENINEHNIKLDFDENMQINQNIFSFQNNNSISQPININNVPNNNFNINNNILDDFLQELEDEENEKNKNCFDKNDKPIENELKGLFERRKYNAYFQTSRTQKDQCSNIWDDFHQKRDKL